MACEKFPADHKPTPSAPRGVGPTSTIRRLGLLASPSPEDSLGRWERRFPVLEGQPHACALLAGCLRFAPGERCSAEEALALAFFAPLHDPEDEPRAAVAADLTALEAVRARDGSADV